jgi:hypothetical protein
MKKLIQRSTVPTARPAAKSCDRHAARALFVEDEGGVRRNGL